MQFQFQVSYKPGSTGKILEGSSEDMDTFIEVEKAIDAIDTDIGDISGTTIRAQENEDRLDQAAGRNYIADFTSFLI